ncbi:Glyoxalase family protein [Sandaracinus amylolyticus]|uniref:Glyoxalase family protein n=2 Tax=Sandaracinus amylolyticus TaxID=927083 RepID=A0A0F6WAD2_9BACT|nr:Glyoxalase family protein [Sandaracinus amylolyticus]
MYIHRTSDVHPMYSRRPSIFSNRALARGATLALMAKRPNSYPRVSAYLICPGAPRVIEFAKNVLDAQVERRYDAPDGSVMHAELRIDDSIVMIGDSGEQWPAVPTHLHVYVDDVDATYQRALAAGATSVRAPEQREGDPDRRGGVLDVAGNTWWFATQLE